MKIHNRIIFFVIGLACIIDFNSYGLKNRDRDPREDILSHKAHEALILLHSVNPVPIKRTEAPDAQNGFVNCNPG